jgi:hypothetical protein
MLRRQILMTLAAPLAMLALALTPLSASAGQLPTGPAAGDMTLSPFYRWDGPLPKAPGSMLRREPMPAQAALSHAGEALRILYTSTDVRWGSGPVPVSGVLYLPQGEPPAGGWPLLTWAHGTLGIADVCAPSWTGPRERDAVYIDQWLAAGFAVVATDYQGLGGPGPHPYLYWQAEGRSVLDAARAALAEKSGRIADKVLIGGQSQGSSASLGALKLATEYAPDLKVLGAVATGVNTTFPDGPIAQPPRNSSNLFLSLAAGGLRDDAPKVEDIVSANGALMLAQARTGCNKQIGQLARELKIGGLADALKISLDDLARIRLPVTDMDQKPIAGPIFIGTGLSDATTTPLRQYAAVSALCAAGDRVVWRRYEGLGHDGAMHGSLPDSIAFGRALLAGQAIASSCGELTPPGPPGALAPKAPFNAD